MTSPPPDALAALEELLWNDLVAGAAEARTRKRDARRARTPRPAPAPRTARASRGEARVERPITTYAPCAVRHQLHNVRCTNCGAHYTIPAAEPDVRLRAVSGPGSESGLFRYTSLTAVEPSRLARLPQFFEHTWTQRSHCHAPGCTQAASAVINPDLL